MKLLNSESLNAENNLKSVILRQRVSFDTITLCYALCIFCNQEPLPLQSVPQVHRLTVLEEEAGYLEEVDYDHQSDVALLPKMKKEKRE